MQVPNNSYGSYARPGTSGSSSSRRYETEARAARAERDDERLTGILERFDRDGDLEVPFLRMDWSVGPGKALKKLSHGDLVKVDGHEVRSRRDLLVLDAFTGGENVVMEPAEHQAFLFLEKGHDGDDGFYIAGEKADAHQSYLRLTRERKPITVNVGERSGLMVTSSEELNLVNQLFGNGQGDLLKPEIAAALRDLDEAPNIKFLNRDGEAINLIKVAESLPYRNRVQLKVGLLEPVPVDQPEELLQAVQVYLPEKSQLDETLRQSLVNNRFLDRAGRPLAPHQALEKIGQEKVELITPDRSPSIPLKSLDGLRVWNCFRHPSEEDPEAIKTVREMAQDGLFKSGSQPLTAFEAYESLQSGSVTYSHGLFEEHLHGLEEARDLARFINHPEQFGYQDYGFNAESWARMVALQRYFHSPEGHPLTPFKVARTLDEGVELHYQGGDANRPLRYRVQGVGQLSSALERLENQIEFDRYALSPGEVEGRLQKLGSQTLEELKRVGEEADQAHGMAQAMPDTVTERYTERVRKYRYEPFGSFDQDKGWGWGYEDEEQTRQVPNHRKERILSETSRRRELLPGLVARFEVAKMTGASAPKALEQMEALRQEATGLDPKLEKLLDEQVEVLRGQAQRPPRPEGWKPPFPRLEDSSVEAELEIIAEADQVVVGDFTLERYEG